MATTLPPGLHLTPADCDAVADVLAELLVASKTRGHAVPPLVEHVIHAIERVAEVHRAAAVLPGTNRYRSVAPVDTAPPEWVSITAGAEIDGTSPRNLRKKAERGTIRARKVGNQWQLDRADLRAC